MLRGQYSYAAPAIDRALELETIGAALTFLGALVQRAGLYIGVGDMDAARPLVERAITRYTGADHVYAETMAAYAHVVRGSIAERTGRPDAALEDFDRACQIADGSDHRITIGAQWVRGRLGRARVLHQLGRAAHSERALGEAQELFGPARGSSGRGSMARPTRRCCTRWRRRLPPWAEQTRHSTHFIEQPTRDGLMRPSCGTTPRSQRSATRQLSGRSLSTPRNASSSHPPWAVVVCREM